MNQLKSIFLGLSLLLATSANATLMNVNDQVNVGALQLTENFVNFYDYSSASGHTGYEQEDTIVLFFAEYQNELALYSLFNAAGGSGGTNGTAKMVVSNWNKSNQIFKDDVGESQSAGTVNFTWNPKYSDGLVYKVTDDDFNSVFSNLSQVSSIKVLDFSTPVVSETVLFSANDIANGTSFSFNATAVPEPGTIAILSLAMFGLVLRNKRQ